MPSVSTLSVIRVRVADLVGLLVVVAHAGDPVDAVGCARELELLVEAFVALRCSPCRSTSVDQVGAVLVFAVHGVELTPRSAGAELRAAERVVDEQVRLVELARFLVADDIVVDRGLARIEVGQRRRPGRASASDRSPRRRGRSRAARAGPGRHGPRRASRSSRPRGPSAAPHGRPSSLRGRGPAPVAASCIQPSLLLKTPLTRSATLSPIGVLIMPS